MGHSRTLAQARSLDSRSAISRGGHARPDTESCVARALIAARTAGEDAVRERFARAKNDGDLPEDCDPAELAAYVRTVIYGMTVKAAGGATRAELERVVDLAMRAWPSD